MKSGIVLAFCVVVLAVVAIAVAYRAIARRKAEKAGNTESDQALWDPVLCEHGWKKIDEGECPNTHSRFRVNSPCEMWMVERCELCKTKRFSCSDASCPDFDECRRLYEADSPHPGKIEEEFVGRVADERGIEYSKYRLSDCYGNERMGYRRIVPTTFRSICPDCGGSVVGVDAERVLPGGSGPLPTAFCCKECGRQQKDDFGVMLVEDREGDLSFEKPLGEQPACPEGGCHDWSVVEASAGIEWPEGVEPCTENLIFANEVEYTLLRCEKCGKTSTSETIVSRGQAPR